MMNTRKLVSMSVVAGALLAASSFSHADLVTLNPKGSPLLCNKADVAALVDCSTFQADTVAGRLGSDLKIDFYRDAANLNQSSTYTETGVIEVNTWFDGLNITKLTSAGLVPTTGFQLWADFVLTGNGVWGDDLLGNRVFSALTGTLTTGNVFADFGGGPVLLATLELLAGNLQAEANVGGNGGIVPNTDLSADFAIKPVAGSTGVGGFFELPAVWNVELSANNVGFGSGTGGIIPTTPVNNAQLNFVTNNYTVGDRTGTGSFNGSFRQMDVPEPANLALAGLALIGVAATRRRNARKD